MNKILFLFIITNSLLIQSNDKLTALLAQLPIVVHPTICTYTMLLNAKLKIQKGPKQTCTKKNRNLFRQPKHRQSKTNSAVRGTKIFSKQDTR